MPVAYSETPDPSWIAGYWDDDDFDNAVVVIVAPCAIDLRSPLGRKPLFAPAAQLDAVECLARRLPLLAAVSARAPPVAPFPPPLLISN